MIKANLKKRGSLKKEDKWLGEEIEIMEGTYQ
jgi:hypothetical protein